MFSTIAAQTTAKLLLGMDVYERVFKTATTAKVKNWTGPLRFCKGQAVGQPRDSGAGPKDLQKAQESMAARLQVSRLHSHPALLYYVTFARAA
jgi:predicted negative regulator of RcsB-dependent stress response